MSRDAREAARQQDLAASLARHLAAILEHPVRAGELLEAAAAAGVRLIPAARPPSPTEGTRSPAERIEHLRELAARRPRS